MSSAVVASCRAYFVVVSCPLQSNVRDPDYLGLPLLDDPWRECPACAKTLQGQLKDGEV
jgi:hypothetical protein